MAERPDKPLTGRTVALPETRELDLFADMLEKRGATVVRCPLVTILDAPDPTPVEAWLKEAIAGRFDDVILYTGEGLRRLLGFADRAGVREPFVEALGRVRKITRGPKPVKALREVGLRPDLPAEAPTTDGILSTLSRESLAGRTIGVQLYGQEPNPKLIRFLEAAGATPRPVAPYVYASATDDARVAELVSRLGAGSIDVLAFTSASQVKRLWDVARQNGLADALDRGLAGTTVAAIGPVAAEELRAHGTRVDIVPDRRFALKPLTDTIIQSIRAREPSDRPDPTA